MGLATLQPRVTHQDIEAARRSIVDVLSACVVERDGRAGIPNAVDAALERPGQGGSQGRLGVHRQEPGGRLFLLREADIDSPQRGEHLRHQAEAIIESFLRLQVSPPAGEGFSLDDGHAVCAIGGREVFLRSFGDAIKALLKAYRHERTLGRAPSRVAAMVPPVRRLAARARTSRRRLPQELAAGHGKSGFRIAQRQLQCDSIANLCSARRLVSRSICKLPCEPRSSAGTTASPAASSSAAPSTTRTSSTRKRARSRSKRTWPCAATGNLLWIDRAKVAADFAESWIYLWNVPIPEEDHDPKLHWKHGVPTVGLQLISTGHSLVDAYMAYDVDEFAELHLLTGDVHYLDVARLLLHNTKTMLALPGRTFDLGSPGWQQEHWSLAPHRGYGLHRLWLPWVATSQLNGIFGLMDLDENLYHRLATGGDSP